MDNVTYFSSQSLDMLWSSLERSLSMFQMSQLSTSFNSSPVGSLTPAFFSRFRMTSLVEYRRIVVLILGPTIKIIHWHRWVFVFILGPTIKIIHWHRWVFVFILGTTIKIIHSRRWVFVRKSFKIFEIQKGRTFSFNDILRLCTIVVNIAIRSREK